MAVLVEATSVIVRVQTIYERYDGGWTMFAKNAPNRTLCSDNEVARIGFMSPDDCRTFVDHLNHIGMTFLPDRQSQDIVVADQLRGFTCPCDWADFGRVEIRKGQRVSAVRLKDSANRQVFCPNDWHYEGSLSQQFGFVPAGKEQQSLWFLRHEQGLDVYLNMTTGSEVCIARTSARS
jgi:hypothetical protein